MIPQATSTTVGGVKLQGALAGGTAEHPQLPAGYVTSTMLAQSYALASALAGETSRAQAAEAALQAGYIAAVDAEVNARVSALASEASTRASADAALNAAIAGLAATTITANLQGQINALQTALTTETNRAEAAEGVVATTTTRLQSSLTAETARAQAAEVNAVQRANNLSDVTNVTLARANLGLGSAAQQDVTAFDTAGAAAAVQSALNTEIARATAIEATKLAKSLNLSDLPSPATARTNLGLGSAALQPTSAFDAAGAAATEQARAQGVEATKANDSSVVHLAGTETITGSKNFTGGLKSGGTAVVVTTDSRLSDARNPLAGSVSDASVTSGGLTNASLSPTAAIAHTKLDAFAQTALAFANSAVQSVNGHSAVAGSVTLNSADVAAVPNALITQKGDVIVGSSAANPQILGVGSDSNVLIADSTQPLGVRWGTIGSAGSTNQLAPTSTQTTTYNASALDFVVVDATATSVTVNLPNAPADLTRVGVILLATASGHAANVTAQGADVIQEAPTTVWPLVLVNQVTVFQYKASTKTWFTTSGHLQLSALDARYDAAGAAAAEQARAQTAEAALAPINSPTFTGTAQAPTPALNDDTNKIATTAWYVNQGSSTLPAPAGTAAIGTSLAWARADHVHPTDPTRAPVLATLYMKPSGGDDAATLAAEMTAAATRGYSVIVMAPGTYLWNSAVPQIPAGVPIRVVGSGRGRTVIKLSASAPRFLDPTYSGSDAGGATFNDITLLDFTLDDNNVGGAHHLLLGAYVNGTQITHLNWSNVTLRNIDVINVPTTASTRGVSISVGQTSANEAGANSITDVYIDSVRVFGGRYGFQIIGTGTVPQNITIDRVAITNWYHDVGAVPVGNNPSANVQIGLDAVVGARVLVAHGEGRNSNDHGVSISSAQRAVVENVVVQDAWKSAFFNTNYQAPANPNSQTYSHTGCRAIQNNVQPQLNPFCIQTNNFNAIGRVIYDRCVAEMHGVPLSGQAFFGLPSAQVYSATYRNCKVVSDGWNYNSTSALTSTLVSLAPTATNNIAPTIIVDGLEVVVSGAQSGTGVLTLRGLELSGVANLDVRNVIFDVTVTNQTAGATSLIYLGASASTLTGKIRDLRVRQVAGDITPTLINVSGTGSLTIPGTLNVQNLDLGGLPTGGKAFSFGSPSNAGHIYCPTAKDWGARGGAKAFTSGASISGSVLTDATNAPFTSSDIGKTINLPGAGTSGWNFNTTISGYTSASQVTLSSPPPNAAGATGAYQYGYDDTAAIQNALNAIALAPGDGHLVFPPDVYMWSSVTPKASGLYISAFGAIVWQIATQNAVPANANALFYDNTLDGTTIKSNFKLMGGEYHGEGLAINTANGSNQLNAVWLRQWTDVMVRDTIIDGFANAAITYLNVQRGWMVNNHCTNCTVVNQRNVLAFADATCTIGGQVTNNQGLCGDFFCIGNYVGGTIATEAIGVSAQYGMWGKAILINNDLNITGSGGTGSYVIGVEIQSYARKDTATVTSGSATVADTSILAQDTGRPVTGTGIPANTFVGTVTPGVSFLLSSSSSSQVNVNATSNGTSVTINGGGESGVTQVVIANNTLNNSSTAANSAGIFAGDDNTPYTGFLDVNKTAQYVIMGNVINTAANAGALSTSAAIQLFVSRAVVSGNTVTESGTRGQCLYWSAAPTTLGSQGAVVSDNYFYQNNATPNNSICRLRNLTYLTFSDNLVQSIGTTGTGTTHGVSIESSGYWSATGNRVIGAVNNGFSINPMAGGVLSDNHIVNANAANTASTSSGNGIYLTGTATTTTTPALSTTPNVISGNVVFDDRVTHQMLYAVYNANSTGLPATLPLLRNNVLRGALTGITNSMSVWGEVKGNNTDVPQSFPAPVNTPGSPASGSALTSIDPYEARYFWSISGGSLTSATYTRSGGSAQPVGTANPITLGTGDSWTPTYTGSLTLTKVPLA